MRGRVAFQNRQRGLGGSGGGQDAIAQAAQHFGEVRAQLVVVLDNQDGFAMLAAAETRRLAPLPLPRARRVYRGR